MAWWFRTLAGAAMLAAASGASAQPFPSRPVHILVPYAAGGAVDILARTLGDAVSQKWGQSVVIENRPGAGGVIASQALVTSAPDGYTLIVVASGHPTNPFLYEKLPYDTFKDFTPISLLASSVNGMPSASSRSSRTWSRTRSGTPRASRSKAARQSWVAASSSVTTMA